MDSANTLTSNMVDEIEPPLLKIRAPKGWAALNIIEVWRFRDLLFALAGRDVKLRYKQTALGMIWVVLQPLMAAGVFSFVFGVIARIPSEREGLPYFVTTFAGLLGWNLFNNTLGKISGSLIGNSQLISKIFFPRLVLPFSAVPSVLIDFAVAMGMMIVLMLVYHVQPTAGLLLLPVWILLLLMLAMGVGLITSALTVSYRDVAYMMPVLTQILMYASPIAYGLDYALSRLPAQYRIFYLANPLAAPLEAFRSSLLHVGWPPVLALVYSAVVSIVMMVIGAYSFKKMERKFADVI